MSTNNRSAVAEFMIVTLTVCFALMLMVSGCAKKNVMADPTDMEPTSTPTPTPTETPTATPGEPGIDEYIEGLPVSGRFADARREDLRRDGPLKRVFFDYDQADLTSEARITLQRNAEYLQQNPSIRVIIEGHCDERGTNSYNLALGQRRAEAVRSYLVFLGISGSRLTPVSFGEERPMDPSSHEEAWARNRRAQFVKEN